MPVRSPGSSLLEISPKVLAAESKQALAFGDSVANILQTMIGNIANVNHIDCNRQLAGPVDFQVAYALEHKGEYAASLS